MPFRSFLNKSDGDNALILTEVSFQVVMSEQ